MISVVIIAYNEEKNIKACLDSFLMQKTNRPFEIILVDNASTDRTAEVASSFIDHLPLRIIREPKKGRGAARAAGFKAATGEVILSTDGDTLPPSHWIDALAEYLERHPKSVAVSGPCHIDDCSFLTNLLFNIIQPLTMHLYRVFFGHYWLTGSNFGIWKSAYEASGGFNPDSPSSEDTELAFKVKKLGKIRYVPCAVISSGRRFRGGIFGLIKGLFSYPWTWIERFVLKKKNADLSDVR